jgi:hypothetical protein
MNTICFGVVAAPKGSYPTVPGRSKNSGTAGRFPRVFEGRTVTALHNPRWCEDCAGVLIGVGSFAARLKSRALPTMSLSLVI